MPRRFVYDGREFPDPSPELSPEEVRHRMADLMPELANATVSERAENGDQVFEFTKRVGTKGAGIAG